MKITREKASQRLHHRVKAPLSISIDGRAYKARDWSMGGFRVADWDRFDEELKPGTEMDCYFKLPFQGFDIAFDVRVELVRTYDGNTTASFTFMELSERQVELLQHFVEQLVRGAMTPIGDTILRIDSPVTPISTKPDPSPMDEVPAQRWPIRLICMSIFYLVTGAILFSFLGWKVYENILSLKVETAVTATPVEPLVSLVDGRIKKVAAKVDQEVSKGEVLIVIDSPSANRSIDEAKTDLEGKKMELELVRKKYQVTQENKTKSKGALLELELEIEMLKNEITLLMQKIVSLYEYRDNLSIMSPDNGRLVALMRNHGSTVKSGETIGLFERSQFPSIHAFVTEKEAATLRVKQYAQVYIQSLDIEWEARVMDIRPDKAFLIQDGYRYRSSSEVERTVVVELAVIPMDRPELYESLRSGLPVEVFFPVSKISKHIPRKLRTMFENRLDDSSRSADTVRRYDDAKIETM